MTFTVLVTCILSTYILILFTSYKNINPFKVHIPKYLDINQTDIYVSTLGMKNNNTNNNC